MDYNKAIKTAGFMTMTTILAKVLGLLRDMVLAAFYATGPELTAFLAASKIPLLLFDVVIGGVISATFIPVYNSVLVRGDKKKAFKFTNDYVNLILVITIVLTIVGVLFGEYLIQFTLTGSGISTETRLLATQLSRIMFAMIIFTGLAYSFVGILNSNGEFYITSILSLVSNIIIIVYFILFREKASVYGLAITMLFAWASQALIQVPYLKKYGFRYKPSFTFNTPEIKMAIALALPMLISTWAQPLSSLINMRMASYLNNGSAVSALELANRLYIVITGVFAYVASNLSFPYLAKAEASGQKDVIKKMKGVLLNTMTFIMAPIMIGLILLAHPIVRVVYERGNFTAADSALTAAALMSCAFGMLALSYNEILNKIFYALKNSKVPMYTAMVGIACNIFLSMKLPTYFGIAGLGYAIAAGSIITALLNLIMMSKELGSVFEREELMDFLKVIVAVALMGLVVVSTKNLLEHKFLSVILPTVLGALVYFLACGLLKVSTLQQFRAFLNSKMRLKRGEADGR